VGTVSIFFIIIIAGLLLSFSVFMDVLVQRSARNEWVRVGNRVMDNTLAKYHSALHYRYGLLGKYNTADTIPEIEMAFKSRMDERSKKGNGRFDILKVSLNQVDPGEMEIRVEEILMNEAVLKAQIKEIMKYRIGVNVLDEMAMKLGMLKKAGKTSEILEGKEDLEKKLSKYGKDLEDLEILIVEINTMDDEKIKGLKILRQQLEDDWREAHFLLQSGKELSEQPKGKEDGNARAVGSASGRASVLGGLISDCYHKNKEIHETLDRYYRVNEQGLITFERIIESASEANKELDDFAEALEDRKEAIFSEVYSGALEEIQGMKRKFSGFTKKEPATVFNSESGLKDEIDKAVAEYISRIDRGGKEDQAFLKTVAGDMVRPMVKNKLIAEMLISQYTMLKKKRIKRLIKASRTDLRDRGNFYFLEGCENEIGSLQTGSYKERDGKNKKSADSYYQEIKKENDREAEYSKREVADDGEKKGVRLGWIRNLPSKLLRDGLKDVEQGILIDSERLLEGINREGAGQEKGDAHWSDTLIINEYILGTFKYDGKPCANDIDYFGKYERESYLSKGEVEYILFGAMNENENIFYASAGIYGIRLLMNTIHVFSDAEKRHSAQQIGILVAGWTGFGAPLVTNVIIGGWAAMESAIDLSRLRNGESVPFYKVNKNQWRLGIEGIPQLVEAKIEDRIDRFTDSTVEAIAGEVIDRIDLYTAKGEEGIQEIILEGTDKIENELIKGIIRESMDSVDLKGFVADLAKKNINAASEQVKYKTKAMMKEKMYEIKERLKSKLKVELNQVKDVLSKDKIELAKKQVGSEVSRELLFSYVDYLRVFLVATDESSKLRRIMDLIQLNQQKEMNNPDLMLSDYVTAYSMTWKVKGKSMFKNPIEAVELDEQLRIRKGY